MCSVELGFVRLGGTAVSTAQISPLTVPKISPGRYRSTLGQLTHVKLNVSIVSLTVLGRMVLELSRAVVAADVSKIPVHLS